MEYERMRARKSVSSLREKKKMKGEYGGGNKSKIEWALMDKLLPKLAIAFLYQVEFLSN